MFPKQINFFFFFLTSYSNKLIVLNEVREGNFLAFKNSFVLLFTILFKFFMQIQFLFLHKNRLKQKKERERERGKNV